MIKKHYDVIKAIFIAVVITAILVGGAVCYFTGSQSLKIESQEQGDMRYAQSSKEYASMGSEVWSAFQCSVWASHIGEAEEGERLFAFGYEQGKNFLAALVDEKIEQEDISSEVPIGVTMLLRGPSEEFILGRIYSGSAEDALSEVFKTGDKFNSDELQKLIASDKFRDGNCQLLGK